MEEIDYYLIILFFIQVLQDRRIPFGVIDPKNKTSAPRLTGTGTSCRSYTDPIVRNINIPHNNTIFQPNIVGSFLFLYLVLTCVLK